MKLPVRTILLLLLASISLAQNGAPKLEATRDNGEWFLLNKADIAAGAHHTRHAEIFGK